MTATDSRKAELKSIPKCELLGSNPRIRSVMLVFGFKERPSPFFSDPQPRGRHVLAPRDPGDPATLPTLPPTSLSADDINTMPFTTLLSAQIAE